MPPIVSQSDDQKTDALLGSEGLCGHPAQDQYKDRCGYGPRLPFIVISPYAKVNYVDHSVIDQTSIIKFIEDNRNLDKIGDQSFDEKAGFILDMFDFNSGRRAEKLILDPTNGTISSKP
jgi:phospholipase C